MIFVIRSISALCLFAFLGKANLWLSPLSNVILVMGYRFFLILSPLASRHIGKHAGTVAFLLASLGCLLWTTFNPTLSILGSTMVGVGLSIGGFLIKSEAAETPKGAAWNKIALNLGSFAAGPILAISILTPSTFFSGGLVLLVLCAIISWKNIHRRNKIATQRLPKKPTLQKKIAWSLIGFSIGIKLFGIFSILPQTILKTTGQIPAWYGIMISLNSLVIIFLQLPIIHQLTRHKNPDRSAFYALIAGMFILGSASFFRVDTLYGAILWTLLCSVIECSASYLDSSASKDGALIFKEASVGLGAATVVAVMRVCPAEMGAMIVGGLGLLALTIGMALKWKYFSIASVKFSR